MTRQVATMDRYELARVVSWYDRAMTLAGSAAVRRYQSSYEGSTLDGLQDALYWLGHLRHHLAAAEHLNDDHDRERASLAERLARAEQGYRIAESNEAAKRLAGLRSAMAEWDARRSWHLDQAESAAQECVGAASSLVAMRSQSNAFEIATDLAEAIEGMSNHDVEMVADYLQAVQAVFEFTGADDWTQAASIASAGKSFLSARESDAERKAFWRRLEGRPGHRGVMLGGSVSQERRRRTRGAGS